MIIKSDIDSILPYLTDASNFKGNADIVYIPESVEELKEILIETYKKNQHITISGAGTGLTGGRVPIDGIVISIEKLDKILKIDIDKKLITVQPGVLLSQVEEALKHLGYFLPPNPTEKNCSIGGNISTNASGARTFKYGPIRNWVDRLKILLPDGEILNLKRGENHSIESTSPGFFQIETESGKTIPINIHFLNMPDVKHAAGYYLKPGMDLIDMFIGSEGTLGVVTEIDLKFIEIPEKILGAIVYFDNEDSMIDFIEKVRDDSIMQFKNDYRNVSEINTRLIELFDKNSLDLLKEDYNLIPDDAIGAVWIEQEYSQIHEEEILNQWSEIIKNYTSLADETWIAMNEREHSNMRDFRHAIPLKVNEIIVRKKQVKIGTDIAVPNNHCKEFYYFILKELKMLNLPYVLFGHIGNSHFHTNLFAGNEGELLAAKTFYDDCISVALHFGGTISAEHGVGKLKTKYLQQMFGEHGINDMKSIKKIFDPRGLLGKGNLFDVL